MTQAGWKCYKKPMTAEELAAAIAATMEQAAEAAQKIKRPCGPNAGTRRPSLAGARPPRRAKVRKRGAERAEAAVVAGPPRRAQEVWKRECAVTF